MRNANTNILLTRNANTTVVEQNMRMYPANPANNPANNQQYNVKAIYVY